jgi:fatty-acyl-CoA synthase
MSSVKVEKVPRIFLEAYELWVERKPDSVALVNGDRKETWKDLDTRANSFARALLDLNIKRQDRIIVSTYPQSSLEFIETWYGARKIGVVSTYLNTRYIGDEIVHIVNISADASVVIVDKPKLPDVLKVKDKLKAKDIIVIGGDEGVPENVLVYEDLLKKKSGSKPEMPWTKPMPDDMDCFVMTTGTTGKPKGAVKYNAEHVLEIIHSQILFENMIEKVYDNLTSESALKRRYEKKGFRPGYFARALAFTGLRPDMMELRYGDEKFFITSPLPTGAGACHALAYLGLGASVLLPSSMSFNPQEVLKIAERERATGLLLAGDVIALPLVNELKRSHYNLSDLGLILSTGMIFTKDIKTATLKNIPSAIILDGHSLSEAFHIAVNVAIPGEEPHDYFETYSGVNVVLLDENGNIAKPGEPGEVVARREFRREEYFNEPEKTAKTFRVLKMPFQGIESLWVFTGDYGVYDKNGNYKLIGRSHDIINSGGLKVFAPEIAECIAKHPDVMQATVVGTPHERWGEAVTAVVKLKEGSKVTEQDIINFCKGKLADYKVPKRVVITNEPLPTDFLGKIRISEVKKIALEKLGLK